MRVVRNCRSEARWGDLAARRHNIRILAESRSKDNVRWPKVAQNISGPEKGEKVQESADASLDEGGISPILSHLRKTYLFLPLVGTLDADYGRLRIARRLIACQRWGASELSFHGASNIGKENIQTDGASTVLKMP
jgi:hypothetical protein